MAIFDTLKNLGIKTNALQGIGIDTLKDLKALDFVLSNDIEFIDNPLFHQDISNLFSLKLPDGPIWKDDKPSNKVILTPEQERIAFLRYNFFLSVVVEKKVILDNTKTQQKKKNIVKSIWEWYRQAQNVKEYIVACNLRLVMSQAHKFCTMYKIDMHELVSTGSLGLIKSMEKFDIAQGNKFSTYAYWSIIRLFNRLNEERNKKKNISTQIVEINDNTGSTIEPILKENENADSIDMINIIMDQNLANLTEIEDSIIRLRFFHGDRKPSAESVSEQLDIKPAKVYFHEKKAFDKIRMVIREKFS